MKILTRSTHKLPRGIGFARYAKAIATTHGDLLAAASYADAEYNTTPTVPAALRLRAKGDVSASSTSDAPSLGYGISSEALIVLRDRLSLFDAATERGMRRLPFSTPAPRQTDSGVGGAWVAEGAPVPVISHAFDTLTLDPFKVGILVVVSRELLKMSGTLADTTLRDMLLGALAQFTDQQWLTASVTATSAHPASILNGATAITSTGVSAAQLTADLAGMVAAITTSGAGLVWIMKPTTAARLSIALGAAAAELPARLFGLPALVSANSPQQIALVDLAEVAYASGPVDLDLSTVATVEMDSAPTNNSLMPTETTTVSLYATNSAAFRITRPLTWARVRSGAASVMTVAY